MGLFKVGVVGILEHIIEGVGVGTESCGVVGSGVGGKEDGIFEGKID